MKHPPVIIFIQQSIQLYTIFHLDETMKFNLSSALNNNNCVKVGEESRDRMLDRYVIYIINYAITS